MPGAPGFGRSRESLFLIEQLTCIHRTVIASLQPRLCSLCPACCTISCAIPGSGAHLSPDPTRKGGAPTACARQMGYYVLWRL